NIVFNSTNSLNLGIKYISKQWQPTYGLNNSGLVSPALSTGNVNATIKIAVIPTVSVKFYGLVGPYASIGLQELMKANIVAPSFDWDFYAGLWLQTTLGMNSGILGNSVSAFNRIWNSDTLFYETPYGISKVS